MLTSCRMRGGQGRVAQGPRPVSHSAAALRPQRAPLVVSAHGHGGPATAAGVKTEKDKGFVADMRKVAMKLHTKEQAPKEGERDAPKAAPRPWAPSRENYLRFLAESKAVYSAMEGIIREAKHADYAAFQNSGLERTAALEKDIAWFHSEYQLSPPPVAPNGPGMTYAAKLAQLAEKDPQAFICHFYNFYFAHTAGGRMIGGQMSKVLLGGKELAFYQWEGDMNELLDKVRASINRMAEAWTPEQKAHCLQETEASFTYSGKLLGLIGGSE